MYLEGYFHTIWEAVTGHKIGHISTVDFWATFAAIVTILGWIEKKKGWRLGGGWIIRHVKLFYRFFTEQREFRESVAGWMVEVDQRWEAQHAKVDNLSDNITDMKGVIDLNTKKINSIGEEAKAIKKEVQYNGGSVLLKDAVKDLKTVSGMLLHNQHISDAKDRAKIMLDPTPMFITDSKGDVTLVNFAWCKMVGCSEGTEMHGQGWLRVMPDMKEAKDRSEASRGNTFTGEVIFKHLNGKTLIYTDCKTQVIKDSEGKIIETHGTLEITAIKNIK